jgi:hypothetical protein
VLDPEQENDVTFLGTNEEKIAEPLMYEIWESPIGSDCTITVPNGVVNVNGNAIVTAADLAGTNGVIHITDSVLTPWSNNYRSPKVSHSIQYEKRQRLVLFPF